MPKVAYFEPTLWDGLSHRASDGEPTYAYPTPAFRVAQKLPLFKYALTPWKSGSASRRISEYEGAWYDRQIETVNITQSFYRTNHLSETPSAVRYARHYRSKKFESAIQFLLQKKVKRLLLWLYEQVHDSDPSERLVLPDNPLYRYAVGHVKWLSDFSLRIHWVRRTTKIPSSVSALTLLRLWGSLIRVLRENRFHYASRQTPVPIGFRAHWPKKHGLLRTDFIIDGLTIKASDVLFFLDDEHSDHGKRMTALMRENQYTCVSTRALPYNARLLRNLLRDYIVLPVIVLLDAFFTKADPTVGLYLELSHLMVSMRFEPLLDRYRFRVLVSFHSAGHELVLAPILCERYGTTFASYNFGITVFQSLWADYAFQNPHVFLAWGKDVMKVYEASHQIDRVIHTGFWGFNDYRIAEAKRDRLRQELGLSATDDLVVFYDIPYFPERSTFTPQLLLEFYHAALKTTEIPNRVVILKMKNRHNENLNIYPKTLRADFDALWQQLKSKSNIRLVTTLDWDPVEMIAASDVNVTLEVTTPSTLALLCGKAGFFLNTLEKQIVHPLMPHYMGKLIFRDAASIVEAINAFLAGPRDVKNLMEIDELDGYNECSNEGGLARFRAEIASLSGNPGTNPCKQLTFH
jgi:hypothetical protein